MFFCPKYLPYSIEVLLDIRVYQEYAQQIQGYLWSIHRQDKKTSCSIMYACVYRKEYVYTRKYSCYDEYVLLISYVFKLILTLKEKREEMWLSSMTKAPISTKKIQKAK